MSKAAIRCLLAVSVFGLDADKAGKCEGTSLIQSAKRGELLAFAAKNEEDDFQRNKLMIEESDDYELILDDDLFKTIKMDYRPGIVTTDGNFYMKYTMASFLQTDGTTATGVRGGLYYQMNYASSLMQTNFRCPAPGTTYSSALLQQQDNQNFDATEEGCPVCDDNGNPIFDHYNQLSDVAESETRIQGQYKKLKKVLVNTADELRAAAKRETCRENCATKHSGKSNRKKRRKCKKNCSKITSLTQQKTESSGALYAFYTMSA